jgi:hypothetical protein
MKRVAVSFGATLVLWAGAAHADPAPAPQAPAKAPAVGLDSLLKLPPSGAASGGPRAGGATRQEWEQRFAAARGDVEAARNAIDKAQQELGAMAKGTESWQMSAPGAQAAPAPRLSGVVPAASGSEAARRAQQRERRLTDLEVEANLAGVRRSGAARRRRLRRRRRRSVAPDASSQALAPREGEAGSASSAVHAKYAA